MQLDFTGRQIEITPDLREYTEKHLQKLTRVLRGRFGVHVILTAEKHRRIAEMTGDILSSIHGAIDKLSRQAVRLLQKKWTRKRRPKSESAVLLNVLRPARDHEERQVLETERIPIKPLTIEEAIDVLDGAGNGILVFRNPETERVNVIYRRQDGNVGLIEPDM